MVDWLLFPQFRRSSAVNVLVRKVAQMFQNYIEGFWMMRRGPLVDEGITFQRVVGAGNSRSSAA